MGDIPLTERAVQILEAQRNVKQDIVIPEYSGYVFINSTGGLHTTSTLNKALKKIAKKAGLPPISMHVLRHTFATRCAEANMRPKVPQLIMGHSDISITMNIYAHVVKGEEQKEMNRVATELKNWRKIGEELCKTHGEPGIIFCNTRCFNLTYCNASGSISF